MYIRKLNHHDLLTAYLNPEATPPIYLRMKNLHYAYFANKIHAEILQSSFFTSPILYLAHILKFFHELVLLLDGI